MGQPTDEELKKLLKDRFDDSPLIAALFLVHGDREKDYGNPLDNCQRIADFWSTLFGFPVPVWQVPLAMNLVKVARLMNEPTHYDGKSDIGGYVEVLHRIQKEQKRRLNEGGKVVLHSRMEVDCATPAAETVGGSCTIIKAGPVRTTKVSTSKRSTKKKGKK